MSDRTTSHPFPLGYSGPITDRPAGPQAQAGGATGVYQTRIPLAQVNTSGTSNPTATAIARVFNPSKQLSCAFSVAFEPSSLITPVANFQSAKWTTTAMRPGGRDAREAYLHAIESAINLPRLYEMETAVRMVEISCALTVPLDGGGAAIAGNWVVTAEWEPDQPMCDDDVAALYAKCALLVAVRPTSPLAP